MMRSNRFYLASLRDTVGTNVAFHAIGGRGYVTDLNRAHEFTLEEAQKAWNAGREFDLPLCADRVDALSVDHVDFQLLPNESLFSDDSSEHVAFEMYHFDGNDVFWLTDEGDRSTDFSRATVLSHSKAKGLIGRDSRMLVIPLSIAESARRPTFSIGSLDRRRMVQSAGLRVPDHIKRNRRRKISGKIRFNCPDCGRINWQYNPHEFDGCSNLNCI